MFKKLRKIGKITTVMLTLRFPEKDPNCPTLRWVQLKMINMMQISLKKICMALT
jgi:hypothetical protein